MDSKLYNKLDKICIDNIEIRKRLPSYVKQVPLIIIKHHGNQQILMGNQLNEWFNMASNSNINIKSFNNDLDRNEKEIINKNETEAVNINENNSDNLFNNVSNNFSDNFSFIDNTYNNMNNNQYSILDDKLHINDNKPNFTKISADDSNKKSSFDSDYEQMLLNRQNI